MSDFNEYSNHVSGNRRGIQLFFFLLAFAGLIFNFKDHSLLFQLGRNPILYQEIDPVYWVFMILDLPDLLSQKMALALDSIVVLSCILSIAFPRQNKSAIIFFVAYFIYFVLSNMMLGHHYINVGILIMSLPFIFLNPERFSFAFTFCRFLFCIMMLAAGMWKLVRGNLTHTGQSQQLLITTHPGILINNKVGVYSDLIRFFISHETIGHLLWIVMILLELLFFIGFLTWRKDFWLTTAYLLFAGGGWFFFRIFNYENLLFLITMAPVLAAIGRIFPRTLRPNSVVN